MTLPFTPSIDLATKTFAGVCLAGCAVVAALVPFVWHAARINRLDRWAFDLRLVQHDELFAVGKYVSLLGSAGAVLAFTLILAAAVFIRGRRAWLGVATVVSVASGAAAAAVAKPIVGRYRPPTAALSGESGYGFPSGHSTAAAALSVAVIALLFLTPSLALSSRFRRRIAVTTAAMFAVAVASSRVVVGAHYLTDTVAGLALGAICSAVSFGVGHRFDTRRPGHDHEATPTCP